MGSECKGGGTGIRSTNAINASWTNKLAAPSRLRLCCLSILIMFGLMNFIASPCNPSSFVLIFHFHYADFSEREMANMLGYLHFCNHFSAEKGKKNGYCIGERSFICSIIIIIK